MGRISVVIPDELEKALRLTTIERFDGNQGDLTRAVADVVSTWVADEEENDH